MSLSLPPLPVDTAFDPRHGEAIAMAPGIVRVTAPNASPYTFTGTNSYLLGAGEVVVVDPGPDRADHRAALLAAVGGQRVAAIVLTHTHRDHSAMAAGLARQLDAPLWFSEPHRPSRPLGRLEINPYWRSADWPLRPDRRLAAGERLAVGGLGIVPVPLPGHCANHIGLAIAGTDFILTGDHVMGWSSTLVADPDGAMTDYLASIERLLDQPQRHYLPGHGGPVADGPAYARALLAHRLGREAQILDILARGPATALEITRVLYEGLAPGLAAAAARTVTAHLVRLEETGRVERPDGVPARAEAVWAGRR